MKPVRIRTEKELRSFCAHTMTLCREGESLWLLSGDLDFFRDMNLVFGRALMDMVLRQGQKILLETLKNFLDGFALHEMVTLFVGDEFYVLFPPSCLKENDIRSCARSLRQSLYRETEKRFPVMALKNCHTALCPLESWCPPHIQQVLRDHDIVIEGDRRLCGGSLAVGKLKETGESLLQASRRIIRTVNSLCSGTQQLKAFFRWLYLPAVKGFEHFNNGFMPPLVISFGSAGSGPVNAGPELLTEVNALFHRAEESLREAKKTFRPEEKVLLQPSPFVVTLSKSYEPRRAGAPLMSESELRSRVHELSTRGEKGVMVRLEFSYTIGPRSVNPGQWQSRNASSLGLKGVNQGLGYIYGDMLIRLLESTIYHTVGRWCHNRGVPRRKVLISRFVDTFTLYFTDLRLHEKSMVLLLEKILLRCNESLEGASLSEMRAAIVFNHEKLDGSELFRRAELTMCAKTNMVTVFASEGLFVKLYAHGVEEEGLKLREEEAYYAARRLKSHPWKPC